MSRTVDNLLTLAQADEGRLELLTARVDLRDAVEAAVRAAARRWRRPSDLRARGVDRRAPPTSRPTRSACTRRSTNFIENAIKYTAAGRRGARARLAATASEVGVTVADTAPASRPRPARTSSTASTASTGARRGRAAAAGSAWRSAARSPTRTAAACGSRARRAAAARSRSRWRRQRCSDAYRVRRGAGLKTGGDKVTLRDS